MAEGAVEIKAGHHIIQKCKDDTLELHFHAKAALILRNESIL